MVTLTTHSGKLKVVCRVAVLFAVALMLSGCGRTIGRNMTAMGFGPREDHVKDFVKDARKQDIKYISIENPREPRKLRMTTERAEKMKNALENTQKENEEQGREVEREGQKTLE